MRKPTSSNYLTAFLFVDSRCHEQHDVVQCCAQGSSFKSNFSRVINVITLQISHYVTDITLDGIIGHFLLKIIKLRPKILQKKKI
jgi:hypothetical protein